MWISRKVIFLSASEASPNRARSNRPCARTPAAFSSWEPFLVWVEREVGENSAEEDPKGDDR